MSAIRPTFAPQMVTISPNSRLIRPIIRNSDPFGGQPIALRLPSNLVGSGTILVRTDQGMIRIVNIQQPNTTYRLPVATHSSQTPVIVHKSTTQPLPQAQVSQSVHISRAEVNSQSVTTSSQMSPKSAKNKCKNFLSTLLRLAKDQPKNVSKDLQKLIQDLIDDKIKPEDFTIQLQKELNSAPQPCLVPFLTSSLPLLRHSLIHKEMTIEGIRPPLITTLSVPTQTRNVSQTQIIQTPGLSQPIGSIKAINGLKSQSMTTVLTPMSQTVEREPQTSENTPKPTAPTPTVRLHSKSNSSKSRTNSSKVKKTNSSTSLRDDNDINDVTAMGGVDLLEESQKMMSTNAEIRSCKDEDFLMTTPLHKRINEMLSKLGLEDCSPEVVSLISHAIQERLKTLVQKLGLIAEHRQQQYKNDPKYEVLHDVRSQISFLQELDRIEKHKCEEREREVLIKAAKSRSKADDPDYLSIKSRAKEMQRQESEDLRQIETNETALQAIGNSNKRLKTSLNYINTSHSNTPLKPLRRIKRVSLKDLLFLMETERETIRTVRMYSAFNAFNV